MGENEGRAGAHSGGRMMKPKAQEKRSESFWEDEYELGIGCKRFHAPWPKSRNRPLTWFFLT